jgi:hypothetical protein
MRFFYFEKNEEGIGGIFFFGQTCTKVNKWGLWEIKSTLFSSIITGPNESTRTDPIDFPAIPDAKTSSDRYNTDKFTSGHKEYGRSRIYIFIKMSFLNRYGIVWLDSNKLIFDNDPESYFRSIHTMLLEVFGLHVVDRHNNNDFVVYATKDLLFNFMSMVRRW